MKHALIHHFKYLSHLLVVTITFLTFLYLFLHHLLLNLIYILQKNILSLSLIEQFVTNILSLQPAIVLSKLLSVYNGLFFIRYTLEHTFK